MKNDFDSDPEASAAVDLEQFTEFLEACPDSADVILKLYLDQTERNLAEMRAAAGTGALQEIKRLAHQSAGASASCGFISIVSVFRKIERQAAEGDRTGIVELLQRCANEYDRVRAFVTCHLASSRR